MASQKKKIGIRGRMPAGVLFAVWNENGTPAYIPPEYSEIDILLDELFNYVNSSDDHPIIKAAIIHYQLVTIHPFEDGNGRTARIISNYFLSLNDYGFKNIGSLEEYMSYDISAYYQAIQMGLPVNYYEGRTNPPHPEIWIGYFIRIFNLYSSKVLLIASSESGNIEKERISMLSSRGKKFYIYLKHKKIRQFTPIEISKELKVTNRTIINWCNELVHNGYIEPILVNKRIREYKVLY